jgi:hypothetical protein
MTSILPTFFHGTRAAFRGRGGIVLPGSQVGRDNHSLGTNNYVYVSTDIEVAMDFAVLAKGRGKPRILTVQPFGKMERDTYPDMADQDSWRCEGARVLKVRMLSEDEVHALLVGS